jgi:hypothetical protein
MLVDFQEDQSYRRDQSAGRTSPLITWMLNKGIVKNEGAGNRILLIVSFIFFSISIYLFTR